MTTTTAVPAATAIEFYERARPHAEALASMAAAWRDRAPLEPAAREAFADFTALAIRCDLRLVEQRALIPDQTGAPTIGPGDHAASLPPRRRSMAAPAPRATPHRTRGR